MQNLSNYSLKRLVDILRGLDDLYHNGDQSPLTDEEYDCIRNYVRECCPHHVYFTGIGADVRGGKVKLPYPMGSLDQVEIGDIAKWVNSLNLDYEEMCVTDKVDGLSALLVFNRNGKLQIAYSRGNGIEGADITRHVKHIIPSHCECEDLVIRGELVITEDNFNELKDKIKTKGGERYKNPRNMVAGLINSESNEQYVYDYIDFIGYDVINSKASKTQQLYLLRNLGVRIPGFFTCFGKFLEDDMLVRYIQERKNLTNYEIDGIVIEVSPYNRRREIVPTKDTLNPAYAIKYKVADSSNLAEGVVKEVKWNVTKHGYIKPTVVIEPPVSLMGVSIRHATCFNAKYVFDRHIGPGTRIRLTRSGDVIPFITDVIEGTTAQMPDIGWHWNKSGVDAVVDDESEHDDIAINRITDFFSTIGVALLKKGNVVKLYNEGYTSVSSIIRVERESLIKVLGVNGGTVYDSLFTKLNKIPLYKLMGATHFFGRGIGVRKFKKLIDALGCDKVLSLCEGSIDDVIAVDGFDEKTARKICKRMPHYLFWASSLEDPGYINVDYQDKPSSSDGNLSNEFVVFTGFRDKDLGEQVEENGGTLQSGISGKTTMVVTTNPSNNTGKIKKARDKGVKILTVEELKKMLDI